MPANVSRRQALALIAAVPVALVAADSLPDTDGDASEVDRRVYLAGIAIVDCWNEAASLFAGEEFVTEAMKGALRILRDLEARYGREETVRIVREVHAIMAETLGGLDVS